MVLVSMRGRNDDTGLLRTFRCIILAEVLIAGAVARGHGFLTYRDDFAGAFVDLRGSHILMLPNRRGGGLS